MLLLALVLATAIFREADDVDPPFDQPIPLLQKVPLPRSTFARRLVAVVCTFGAIDLMITAACLWRCLRRRVPPASLSQRLFES